MFLRNLSISPSWTALQPRRPYCSTKLFLRNYFNNVESTEVTIELNMGFLCSWCLIVTPQTRSVDVQLKCLWGKRRILCHKERTTVNEFCGQLNLIPWPRYSQRSQGPSRVYYGLPIWPYPKTAKSGTHLQTNISSCVYIIKVLFQFSKANFSINRVSHEEISVSWEVILRKKVYMNKCPLLNSFRDRAIWMYSCKIIDKK
jgi:hypothetical protein